MSELKISPLLPSFNSGSILFAGMGGALFEDNNKLFWDDTNKKIGIGTASPNDYGSRMTVYDDNSAGGMSVAGVLNPSFSLYVGTTKRGISGVATSSNAFFSGANANDLVIRAETAGAKIHLGIESGLPSLTIDTGKIGLNVTAPTKSIALNGDTAKTIGMERHTVANTQGNALTIQAGSAAESSTNKPGGALYLRPGVSTGTGTGFLVLQGILSGPSGTADNAYTNMIMVQGDKLGLYGASPVAKPTVSGAKGSNAALGSLLTALASMGLITDSSTA